MTTRWLILLCIILCSCTTRPVSIHPKLYPTFNWQLLSETYTTRNDAIKALGEHRYVSAVLARRKALSNWEQFKRSIGIWFELRLEW
jgi:hypothetical protein